MNNRNPNTPVNTERGHQLGESLVIRYMQKEEAIKDINLDSRGQLQRLLTDIMLTLKPQDFIELGFRMNDKGDNYINDMSALGDTIGGQYVFRDFTEKRDYEFMSAVISGIREGLRKGLT